MKLKYEFIVREIVGEYVLVPVGEAALNFGGMITTSEVGAFLMDALKSGASRQTLVDSVLAEYDVDAETAEKDVDEFLANLTELGILENE